MQLSKDCKVFLSGKITGDPDYKLKFHEQQVKLEQQGFKVLNPAVLPAGFEHDEYLKICYAMLDVCTHIYFLEDSLQSKGSLLERIYALENNIPILF